MSNLASLAAQFEAQRERLRAVAYRMLGVHGEADDAVQEAWLRLQRAGSDEIDNLGGWLTTVVARICLDILRARKARLEEPLAPDVAESPDADHPPLPDAPLWLADSLGVALLVVLESLAPAERIAFVLHDLFAVPFDDIAPIVGRTPLATRQLASRARRRVQGASAVEGPDRAQRRAIVDAFLAAARNGDFAALLAALDPDVVLRADALAVATAAARLDEGAPLLLPEVRGAPEVARTFSGRASGGRPALVGGQPGAAWAPGGVVRAAFSFVLAAGKIASVELIMDPDRLRALDVTLVSGTSPDPTT